MQLDSQKTEQKFKLKFITNSIPYEEFVNPTPGNNNEFTIMKITIFPRRKVHDQNQYSYRSNELQINLPGR